MTQWLKLIHAQTADKESRMRKVIVVRCLPPKQTKERAIKLELFMIKSTALPFHQPRCCLQEVKANRIDSLSWSLTVDTFTSWNQLANWRWISPGVACQSINLSIRTFGKMFYRHIILPSLSVGWVRLRDFQSNPWLRSQSSRPIPKVYFIKQRRRPPVPLNVFCVFLKKSSSCRGHVHSLEHTTKNITWLVLPWRRPGSLTNINFSIPE